MSIPEIAFFLSIIFALFSITMFFLSMKDTMRAQKMYDAQVKTLQRTVENNTRAMREIASQMKALREEFKNAA